MYGNLRRDTDESRPFGNLSFHANAGARLYGSLHRSAIRGQAFLRRSCAVTGCVTFLRSTVPFSRFTGAHRFPLQRKCGRTHYAFPGCTVVRRGRLFDKISAAAFFSPADSRVKTANLPSAEDLPRESRSPAPPPPCEMRFRRAAETVYFSPRRTRDSSYCLRSRVPRMFSIILISPSFSA